VTSEPGAAAEAGPHAHGRDAAGQALTAPVPVLLITGPVGVGKSTVAAEAARLLREATIPHALVDLAWIEQCWPVPADDPGNERLTHRNLACMWANFRQVGAGRLLLVRVLEARSLLRQVAEAVPGAEITVVRLRAPLAVLHAASAPGRPATRAGSWAPPPIRRRCWSRPGSRTTWWTTRTAP